jgi:hypothetical protein
MEASTVRKLIHLSFIVALSLPFIFPINIPISVNKSTQDAYNTVQSIPEGSIALINFDFSTQSAPEVYPQALAFLKHAIRRHFKFVITTFESPDAVLYAKQALTSVDLTGYEYGKDYVHLGYFPGKETSISAFGRDVHGLVKTDADGSSIEDMPLMQQIQSAKDISIWLLGSYNSQPFITQIYAPYNAIMISASDGASYQTLYTYYQSKQLKGLLNGARGGAEYEGLLGYAGQAKAIMNVQNFSHVFFIGAIVIGNIIYFRRGKKQ